MTLPPPPAPPDRSGRLAGRRILLCVTGSIAAYKAAMVARLLVKEGADVRTLLTRSAEQFVGPATFAGITGHPTIGDMFDRHAGGESHVTLAATSDLVLVAPATADLLARLSAGRADDTVTALCLCARCPVMIAPAMHAAMWSHPATQRNVATLEADGRVERIGPVYGEVASGDVGQGRMAEPEEILARVELRLSTGDLRGRHLVVTAGPTVEDLDPVRYLSNRSSGKMGFALAEQAALRGARVTLIAGPVAQATPYGAERIDVRSALAMREALWQALGSDLSLADALVMAAAVADYRPAELQAAKMRRESSRLSLELVQNPDLLAEVGHARAARLDRHEPAGPHERAGLPDGPEPAGPHERHQPHERAGLPDGPEPAEPHERPGGRRRPVLVGFALQTGSDDEVLAYARQKLETKGVDLVVANHASDALEGDDNRAALVSRSESEPLARMSKGELAERVLDWLRARLSESA